MRRNHLVTPFPAEALRPVLTHEVLLPTLHGIVGRRISDTNGTHSDGADSSVQNGRFNAAVSDDRSPAVCNTFATPRMGARRGPTGRRIAFPTVVPSWPNSNTNGGPNTPGASSTAENQHVTLKGLLD